MVHSEGSSSLYSLLCSAGCLNTMRVEDVHGGWSSLTQGQLDASTLSGLRACMVVGAVDTCSSGCLNTVTNRHQCGLSETLQEMAFTNVRVEGVHGGCSSLTQGQLNASPP